MIGIGVAIGIAVGAGLALLAVSVFGTTGVKKARHIRRQLLDDAEREAESVRREAQIEAREQAVKLRSEIDAELADRRAQVIKIEERVLAKEEEIERRLVDLARKDQGLADRETHLKQLQDELKELKQAQRSELERIAGMTEADAKSHLLERGEELARHELARAALGALAPERDRVRALFERDGGSPRTLRRLAARGVDRDTLAELAGVADSV